MRKLLFVVTPLFLGGCSGLGTFFHDTVSLPGANPNLPAGRSETMAKVTGAPVSELPLLPEGGDIWPGAPDPLPSLRDVSRSSQSIAKTLDDPNSYFGRMASGRKEDDALFQEGSRVSIGEEFAVKHGVMRTPEAITTQPFIDPSKKYIEQESGIVEIPNGDGTSTLIAPDGTVSIRKTRKN